MSRKAPFGGWRVAGRLALAMAFLGTLGGADKLPPRSPTDPWLPRYSWGSDIASPTLRARMQRHWTYMLDGVPPAYRGKTSPLARTPEVIAQGRKLYRSYCARCHRMDGSGGGDAALSLAMSPAMLRFMIERPEAEDEYLLWTISEGGKPFNTPMPAFGKVLSRKDIWKIVAFMRAGFPGPGRTLPHPEPHPSPRPSGAAPPGGKSP